jgi:hemin uptake protein HemP
MNLPQVKMENTWLADTATGRRLAGYQNGSVNPAPKPPLSIKGLLRKGQPTAGLFTLIVDCNAWRYGQPKPITEGRISATGQIDTMNTGSHDGRNAADIKAQAQRSIFVKGDRMDSKELFADQRELLITHGEDTYRLRLTFQNKLILTK